VSARHAHDNEVPLVSSAGSDKVAEPTDPYVATAVSFATPGYDGMAAMARAFVEEFALMGWPAEHILRLFATPSFAGAHVVYRERGADYVHALIDDVFGPREDR